MNYKYICHCCVFSPLVNGEQERSRCSTLVHLNWLIDAFSWNLNASWMLPRTSTRRSARGSMLWMVFFQVSKEWWQRFFKYNYCYCFAEIFSRCPETVLSNSFVPQQGAWPCAICRGLTVQALGRAVSAERTFPTAIKLSWNSCI